MPENRKPIGPVDVSQEQMIQEMYLRLVGDGTEAHPGLTVEVDRLKRFVANIKWVVCTIAGVVIAAVTTWVMGLWKKI